MLVPVPTTLPLNVAPGSICSTSLVPPNWTAVPPVPVMLPWLTSVVVPPEVVTPVTPLIGGVAAGGDEDVAGGGTRGADAGARALHARQHVDLEIAGAAALGEDAVAAGSRAVGDHIAFGAQ